MNKRKLHIIALYLFVGGTPATLCAQSAAPWYIGPSPTATAYVADSAADYTSYASSIREINAESPIDDTAVHLASPSDLADAAGTKAMEVYPNKAQNEIKVNLQGYEGDVSITLLTSEGLLVDKRLLREDLHHSWLRLSGLDKGVYILQVQSELKSETQEVVIF